MKQSIHPDSPVVHPVILSGGIGTRLWPMSRALYPKQLLPITSDRTMLQETLARATGHGYAAPLVVCNEEHRFIVAEQMHQVTNGDGRILLEPDGRNSGPAAAVGALAVAEQDPDALMLLLPSDHVISDKDGFEAAVRAAAPAAQDGALVTFGVMPTRPETGYGYIAQGPAYGSIPGCYQVTRFVEKPDPETATDMINRGGCYWNSGIFLFKAGRYLEELERLKPEMVAACRLAMQRGARDLDFFRLERESFVRCESLSIDHAVMEHTASAVVVPVDIGWNDIGSWSALWEIGAKDSDGNVCLGEVIRQDVQNSYIRSDGKLVAAMGLSDIVLVVTDDVVLAAAKDRVQDVRALVDIVKAQGRPEAENHVRVVRPWGSYHCVDAGHRFQVKQIVVKPGAKLSLQLHHHRAEHWVVVQGTARVTRGNEVLMVYENESLHIPIGTSHRLENPGKVPLRIIEVQSGGYLGEDDIIRLEDSYGRA